MSSRDAKRDALMAIYRRDGKLTADLIVSEASASSSPLHGAFEWDDEQAAHQHRLAQARSLIESFKVTIETSEVDVVKVRFFVHEKAAGSYAPVEEVRADPNRWAQHLESLKRDARAFARRAAAYKEFGEVVAAIDALEDAA